MPQPVHLLVLTKFPYHVHQHLVSPFHLSICLSMVRWSPNLPYAQKLTKLSDDVAFKVGPSGDRELGWHSKDWDVSLPQKLSKVFTVWLEVMYAITCFIKWLQKTKRFTTFGGWSNSMVVSILVKSMCSRSKGAVTMMGHIGALTWLPSCWMHSSQLLIAFCICVAIPGYWNQSCSKHSVCCWPWCPVSQWPPFMAVTQWAMGLWIAKLFPTHPLMCGNGRGLLDRVLASSTLREKFFLPHYLHHLPVRVSDTVLSS